MKSKSAIFSFFAGVGFLDLGFETSGHEVVFVNELHKPFLNAYKHSRKILRINEPRFGYHEGDMESLTKSNERKRLKSLIKEIRNENRLVGFIGGPPCPDFSSAGKNKGKEGPHGKLSQTYISLIQQQKPDFFLFENVKGLWQTKEHRQFYDELKHGLENKGYVTTEQLVNSLEYGIAQDRERIILLGFRKNLFETSKQAREAVSTFPWDTGKVFSKEEIRVLRSSKTKKGIPSELTVSYWFDKNVVLDHPNSKHHFKPHVIEKFRSIKEGDVSRKSFKRLHRNRYSPTAAYGNNEVHLHPKKNRRLTVAEALAIQSLPKNFALPSNMTLTDMFKAVGNGVPYIPAKALAKSIDNFALRSNLTDEQ